MGLERGKAEVQPEEEEVPKDTCTSSSAVHDFEAELQAILSSLEQREPAHTPDEDKVHARTWCHVSMV